MEAGTPPWRKPWTGNAGGAAFPLRACGEPHRGINVLLLLLAAANRGYTSAHWFTFKQAQELGAHVRKDEKSCTIVQHGTFEKEDEAGETRSLPYAKAYRVFNVDQIEGLPEAFCGETSTQAKDLGTEPNPELDAFFVATGAKIETTDEPWAYYHPARDIIHMPPIATFHDANGFYGEELVAEIGSCMVCATLGLVPDFAQSAAYVESWLKALKDDARLIFKAASETQKALDFLTGPLRITDEGMAA